MLRYVPKAIVGKLTLFFSRRRLAVLSPGIEQLTACMFAVRSHNPKAPRRFD
jgi:hypothetical protein